MATQRILADEDFGRIVIRTRRTARNISMRVRPEGLYVVVPPFSRADKILEAIAPFRPRLLESFRKVAVRLIDFNFSIQADCFRLSLVPSRLRCFTVKEEGEEMRIYCPADTDFGRDEVQKLVRNAIVRALKRRAESFLPPLLEAAGGVVSASVAGCLVCTLRPALPESADYRSPYPLGKLYRYAYHQSFVLPDAGSGTSDGLCHVA